MRHEGYCWYDRWMQNSLVPKLDHETLACNEWSTKQGLFLIAYCRRAISLVKSYWGWMFTKLARAQINPGERILEHTEGKTIWRRVKREVNCSYEHCTSTPVLEGSALEKRGLLLRLHSQLYYSCHCRSWSDIVLANAKIHPLVVLEQFLYVECTSSLWATSLSSNR
jgi:hypothetical protein